MSYSLIKPKKKQLLKNDTKLWIIFSFLVLFVFLIIKIVLTMQIMVVDLEANNNRLIRSEYEQETAVIDSKIAIALRESKMVSTTHAKNRVIKDSLLNIFELVPDQIYLTELTITATSLDIRGFTPSKEVFNYILKPPLESIFESTETTFYPIGNGWLAFRSINKSKEKLIYEKK